MALEKNEVERLEEVAEKLTRKVHVFNLAIGSTPVPQKAQLFGKTGAILQMDWLPSVAKLIQYYPLLSLALEESLSHP